MRRVIAISDLHLGGESPPMLGHPQVLANFFQALTAHPVRAGESLELVIHGDFVDFLAERPWKAWTVDEDEAIKKLDHILNSVSSVSDALARCLKRVDRFTLLLGNHDVELALPRVRDALLRRLHIDSHRCQFIYNNEAYRIGRLLIEHGNRYDSWNRVDHDGLRQTLSALSRGETPEADWMATCPGSMLVVSAMNPVKNKLHFLDLLKPEDKLLALILRYVEPSLSKLFPYLLRYERTSIERFVRRVMPRKAESKFIAAEGWSPTVNLPDDVARSERESLRKFGDESKKLSIDVAVPMLNYDENDLTLPRALTLNQLKELQKKLRGKMRDDKTLDLADPGVPGTTVRECYDAAQKIIARRSADIVIMGHTHLRRDIRIESGRYLNTGTWADLIYLDTAALEETEHGLAILNEWWMKLLANDSSLRICDPTFADIRLSDDGCIVDDQRPLLRRFEGK